MEATFELRPLKSTDIFALSQIIKKIGIKNFKRCVESFSAAEVKKAIGTLSPDEQHSEEAQITVGINIALEIADVIFDRLPECERELYAFLSSLSGLKVKDIQDLPPAVFFEMIIEVIKMPDFKDFFKRASRLFK